MGAHSSSSARFFRQVQIGKKRGKIKIFPLSLHWKIRGTHYTENRYAQFIAQIVKHGAAVLAAGGARLESVTSVVIS